MYIVQLDEIRGFVTLKNPRTFYLRNHLPSPVALKLKTLAKNYLVN